MCFWVGFNRGYLYRQCAIYTDAWLWVELLSVDKHLLDWGWFLFLFINILWMAVHHPHRNWPCQNNRMSWLVRGFRDFVDGTAVNIDWSGRIIPSPGIGWRSLRRLEFLSKSSILESSQLASGLSRGVWGLLIKATLSEVHRVYIYWIGIKF